MCIRALLPTTFHQEPVMTHSPRGTSLTIVMNNISVQVTNVFGVGIPEGGNMLTTEGMLEVGFYHYPEASNQHVLACIV